MEIQNNDDAHCDRPEKSFCGSGQFVVGQELFPTQMGIVRMKINFQPISFGPHGFSGKPFIVFLG